MWAAVRTRFLPINVPVPVIIIYFYAEISTFLSFNVLFFCGKIAITFPTHSLTLFFSFEEQIYTEDLLESELELFAKHIVNYFSLFDNLLF